VVVAIVGAACFAAFSSLALARCAWRASYFGTTFVNWKVGTGGGVGPKTFASGLSLPRPNRNHSPAITTSATMMPTTNRRRATVDRSAVLLARSGDVGAVSRRGGFSLAKARRGYQSTPGNSVTDS